jgi:hypothetical protein
MMRIAQHLQALSLAALVVAPSCSSGGTGAPEESTSATATTTTTTTTTSSPAPDQAAGEPDGPAPDAAELRADPVTGELVGWILDHPDDVSVVVSDVGEAPAVAWNGGTARPIASTPSGSGPSTRGPRSGSRA